MRLVRMFSGVLTRCHRAISKGGLSIAVTLVVVCIQAFCPQSNAASLKGASLLPYMSHQKHHTRDNKHASAKSDWMPSFSSTGDRRSTELVPTVRYDWCEMIPSERHHKTMLEYMTESLENMEQWNWPAISEGLSKLNVELLEAEMFSIKLLANMNGMINQPAEEIIEVAAWYLEIAKETPSSTRMTTDNSLTMPISAPNMAETIGQILWQHADTLAQMLARLDVIHLTETDEQAKKLYEDYITFNRKVLCSIQHVLKQVAPDAFLSEPYLDSDLDEFEMFTLGQVENEAMRWYGNYGVILRYQDIFATIVSDLNFLQNQISEHTRR